MTAWLGHAFRSLRHRDYRLYFFGQMLSLTGTWMQTAALAWLAFALTGESRWPAYVMAAQIGPTFLLGAWGGLLADRLPRRTLIIRTQFGFLATSATLFLLTAWGGVSVWHLIAVMAVHGVVQAIDLPARLAFVPSLVPREDLVNAVALNSLLFNVARTVGPALAGLILLVAGPAACFALNALSYLGVVAALGAMAATGAATPAPAGERRPGLWSGFGAIRAEGNLLGLVLIAAGVSAAGWPTLNLLPGFAARVLERVEGTYGVLLSCVGVGALAAALHIAAGRQPEGHARTALSGVAIVALALFGLSLADAPIAACACAALFEIGRAHV